ncbi:MocR-like pyridoxine biosynthesis transcription factor PdxR [Urinicoccus timonensis]|uniref:MocR-like pyridoxine biosynthesis transcription factor PdxR n=1 Tax=Urinicoccus timonensis TaxID=2024205 RepID=UPI000C06D212|nr:PLP-dependent aminotransferase family protein [Urinicoccus timonensis]
MLFPNLNPKLKTPLYEQLYLHIKEEIHKGNLKKDQQLPSKRALASFLNISINTVTDAYEQLVDEGYLRSLERRGYFVEDLNLQYVQESVEKLESFSEAKPGHQVDFSFNTVDEDLFPYTVWRKCYRDAVVKDGEFLNDPNPKGSLGLRVEIAKYIYSSRGVDVSPHQIIISAGTEFLLFLINQLVPRDTVFAVEDPGYERLSHIFEVGGRKFLPISLDESGMKTQDLEKSPATIACVTPSHQFPTGCIMPLARRMDLLDWAQKKEGQYILEDDYDSEFRYSGRPIPSLKSMDLGDRVIYMGSFSKSISPALRISYMVLPKKLLEIYQNKLTVFQCPVSASSQRALEVFIKTGSFEKHLNRMRNHYRKKREVFVKSLEEYFPQGQVQGEEAGLHLLLHLDSPLDEESLVQGLVEKGYALRGLNEFRSKGSKSTSPTLVLGFGNLGMEEIQGSIRALKEDITRMEVEY